MMAADSFTIPGYNEIIIHAFVDRSEEDDLQESAVILEPYSDFQDKYGLFMHLPSTTFIPRPLIRSEYSIRLHTVSK